MVIGVGAMLHYLGGGTEHDPAEYYGRKIGAADIADDRLTVRFEDGVAIQIWDDGQSCCEHRYMTTDDDVQSLVGGTLIGIEAKPGPEAPKGGLRR